MSAKISALMQTSYSFSALLTVSVMAAGILAISAVSVAAAPPGNAGAFPPPVPLPVAVPNTQPGNAPVPVPVPMVPTGANASAPALPMPGAQPAPDTTKAGADLTALSPAERRLTLDILRDKLVVTRDETWIYRDQMQYLDLLKAYNTSINSVQ